MDAWIGTQGCCWAAHLKQRRALMRKRLAEQHALRHSRRQRKTRYRALRLCNRAKDKYAGFYPARVPAIIMRPVFLSQ